MSHQILSFVGKFSRVIPVSLKRFIYRIKPLAKLIRRMINLSAPEGLEEVIVVSGDLTGMKLLLDLQREKDYWLGTYELELQAAIRDLVQPGWVAYDVGANIGYVTLLLSQAVGLEGKVFAFEPLPANLDRLRANVELNSMDARVTIVPKAVTRSSGLVHFLVGPSVGTGKAEGSAGRQLDYPDTIEVPGVSLDEFILEDRHPTPQVVKMDIEGGETLAFPGMKMVLEGAHPLLFLELHGQESARIAWDMLHEVGYRILHMRSGYPAVDSFESLDWKSYLVAKYPE